MLSEFSIDIKYGQFLTYYKFSIILSVYLNILLIHNNASMLDLMVPLYHAINSYSGRPQYIGYR